MYLDFTGVSNTTLDTLSDLGITITSHSITRYKTDASKEHYGLVNTILTQHIEKAIVLNIDDYHNIYTKWVPNITTTSNAAHLATILMNPIITQKAIPQLNIHNSKLVNAKSIKINLENRFMELYDLSYNQRWGFYAIDDNTRLEELIVHSYDIRLQEKCHIRSMKDIILIDLQKNTLHSLDEYIQAINAVTNIPSM
ncbi:10830_t:CDS:1 [Acaulospora morrowiae]|uniref:10830_t:CDS:1 n=1 Tax=Acaulospora morrowiae TaxID=94023 RepID=A0A9N9AD49_9GLOM|nr:10830_t:CDS:1 [Acaulospora morrowiae]